jgi:selenocysteine lyase/cysteine desulfurase
MAIDLARVRADTPGCENAIHLNNAGSALPPRPVLEAVVGHLELESQVGGYEAAELRHEAIEGAYRAVTRLLSCSPDEIALVENATRAWDMAFYSLPFEAGDRILTSMAEYASNVIAFLQVARRTGAVVEPVPNDEHGQLSVEALRRMLDSRVKLIAVTHVPTNGGLVNPAAAIGAVAREAGVPFLLDACQSAGQIPLDVRALGCDMLSATGRKYLRGPRAIGFLYVRRGLLERLEPPFLDLHAAEWTGPDAYRIRPDARRFENWESYVAGRLGLAAAIDYALDLGIEAIRERVVALADPLRARLAELPGVTVRDLGIERCGIVSFTLEGMDPAVIQERLARRGIRVHTSPRRYTLLDMSARGLEDVVRASLHYYNSEEELDRFCREVSAL